jgi:hypothetical protein
MEYLIHYYSSQERFYPMKLVKPKGVFKMSAVLVLHENLSETRCASITS